MLYGFVASSFTVQADLKVRLYVPDISRRT
jgi:hypothetical protein